MQAKDNPNKSLGGNSLSSIDLKQILLLYKCKRPKFKIRKGKNFYKFTYILLYSLTFTFVHVAQIFFA